MAECESGNESSDCSDLSFDVDLVPRNSEEDYGKEPNITEQREFGAQPYAFEPRKKRRQSVEENTSTQADEEESLEATPSRLLNNDWCSCGQCNCQTISTERECVCCQEIEKVREKLHCEFNGHQCIATTDAFRSVCLQPEVLETAFYHYREI